MKRDYEQLSEAAALLNRYLGQYKHCINKKKNLENRLRDIQFEFNHPLGALKYDGMPHGSSVGVGCAALTYRLDEMETRIHDQMEKSMCVLTEIMDVIDFLPENSMERAIIEHKYIDCFNWNKISMKENISRTPAIRYWRKGLYALLEFEKIQQILKDYEHELEKDDILCSR